jgi:hypothetical protein
MNRREFFGGMVPASVVAVGAGVQTSGKRPLVIVTLGESYSDPDEEFLAKFRAKWLAQFGDKADVAVLGPDVKVQIVTEDACVVHEKLCDYEYTLIGRTPDEVKQLKEEFGIGTLSAPEVVELDSTSLTPNGIRCLRGLEPWKEPE